MMVDIRMARGVVAEMYDGRGWKRKVDKMPDAQVLAIYRRHEEKKEAESKSEPEDLGF